MQALLRITHRSHHTRLHLTKPSRIQPYLRRAMSSETPNLHKDPVTGEMISKSCVLDLIHSDVFLDVVSV